MDLVEEFALEIERATNSCRVELLSVQAKYYRLIIQGVFFRYFRMYERVELYSKEELHTILNALEDIIEQLETESSIDGTPKYDVLQSREFIYECMRRMIQKYNFSDWILE